MSQRPADVASTLERLERNFPISRTRANKRRITWFVHWCLRGARLWWLFSGEMVLWGMATRSSVLQHRPHIHSLSWTVPYRCGRHTLEQTLDSSAADLSFRQSGHLPHFEQGSLQMPPNYAPHATPCAPSHSCQFRLLCCPYPRPFEHPGWLSLTLADPKVPEAGPTRRPSTLPNPLQCDAGLTLAAIHYQHAALSRSTRSAYRSGTNAFMSFMAMHGHTSPHHLPAIDEAILILFVTHCAMNLRLAHTTIKTYLCGVRNLYIEANHGNPLVTVHGQALEKLTLVLRGIKKSQSPNTNRRLPITAPILSALFSLLTGSFFSPFLDALLKASCAMAFFAFLRCGEFTCTGHFDSATQFTLSDISFILHSGIITEARLFLKASKTDPFRHGHIIPLFALSSSLCPIQALQHYLHFRLQLNRNPMSPLLTLQDGSPLSRTRFISMLQCALRSLGLHSQQFTGHSFRIGAASSAAASMVPDHLIQVLGRWASSCYKTYIHTSCDSLKTAQEQMASSHLQRPPQHWHSMAATQPYCSSSSATAPLGLNALPTTAQVAHVPRNQPCGAPPCAR